ncbi:MAG: hypothetical protein HN509_16315 [Halobacteriovoraceae bacterium]|nr:hypothetical protein [Halobacteriovoraceae bacterium]MBT5095355.1 hypothetical protein [Halobacteriovoraceae bacterium]
MNQKIPWIRSGIFDCVSIIFPGLLSLLLLPLLDKPNMLLPVWGWVVLVLLVDVSHVYSTLFRTYLDKEEFSRNKKGYILIPLLLYGLMVTLYATGPLYFWRVLAYLAVYHFMRQQYGFFRIYSIKIDQPKVYSYLDNSTLAISMIYPMIYWHCHLPLKFNWFTKDDFIQLPLLFERIALASYLILFCCYIAKEIYFFQRERIPRNLLLLVTASCWYTGIVYYNGDLAFTLTNVIIHGIPYMALVYVYSEKSGTLIKRNFMKGVPTFLLIILALAFLEEGLWDALVWREHAEIFSAVFYWLREIQNPYLLALIIPLLSLPQVTHYILDGYIWKLRHRDQSKTAWRHILK